MNVFAAVIAKKRVAGGGGGGAISDNFTRANGALGANWTTDSSFTALTIVSNTCKGGTISSHNVGVWTASGVVAANQYAQVKLAVTGSTVGVVLRSDGAGTFYTAFYPACTIYKCIAGSFTSLGSGSTVTDTVNDLIYFEVVGNVLTVKVNGVLKNTLSDSSLTGISGYVGIDIYDNVTTALDDFAGGPI